MITIKSSRIFYNNEFSDGFLIIEDNKIKGFKQTVDHDDYIDYEDNMVIPGLIDVHNHGFGGWSMTDEIDVDHVKGFAKALTAIGVTTALPTAKEEAFEAIVNFIEEGYDGARLPGIHSEGPFWARGGENTVGVTWPLPDVDETQRLIDKAKGHLVFMAIAPELPKAYDVIKLLNEQDILVAICHTEAKANQIYDALEHNEIHAVTHLGNGMQGIHHRDVGTLGAVLLSDNLYYEIITDMNHVCPDMLKIMFKLKPYEKFMMISDSNYMAGLPQGTYERYGAHVTMSDNGLILNKDGRIMGSGKYMLSNIKELIDKVDVPIEDAIRMSTIVPAKFLRMDKEIGSIEDGKLADITIIDKDFNCLATYVDGRLEYDGTDYDSYLNKDALKRKVK